MRTSLLVVSGTCAHSKFLILLHNINSCLTKMVYNVSSGSVLLNFSDNLTQEVLFLEILVPLSFLCG